jgi:predicted  nucleic acid-binding Zn-ribbon protein
MIEEVVKEHVCKSCGQVFNDSKDRIFCSACTVSGRRERRVMEGHQKDIAKTKCPSSPTTMNKKDRHIEPAEKVHLFDF